jgi:hypothetical protein
MNFNKHLGKKYFKTEINLDGDIVISTVRIDSYKVNESGEVEYFDGDIKVNPDELMGKTKMHKSVDDLIDGEVNNEADDLII